TVILADTVLAGAPSHFRRLDATAQGSIYTALGLDRQRVQPHRARGPLGTVAQRRPDRAQRHRQRAVLPEPPRNIGPLTVAAGYTAAQAEARIGGDFFAVQETPFGVRMIIGDVRGKGLAAVAAVSIAIGAFRQEAEYAPSLVTLGRRMCGCPRGPRCCW
ncbi:serine/threonine-protein phosphatase, partial [Kitasatospora sp. NPDC048296]